MKYELAKHILANLKTIPRQPAKRRTVAQALATVAMVEEQWNPPADGDNCEICLGRNGGVRGNENIIDGVVMCDQCHADTPS
jgi:hypothetical protein